jgi:hypothetical protein
MQPAPWNKDAHGQTFSIDLTAAKRLFGLLGFSEAMSAVVSGPTMLPIWGWPISWQIM